MKITLNTSTIKPQPLMKKIELVAKAGYDGIELWLNDIYEYVGQGGEVSDVEKALADHGLVDLDLLAVPVGGGEADLVEQALELAGRRHVYGVRSGVDALGVVTDVSDIASVNPASSASAASRASSADLSAVRNSSNVRWEAVT